MVASGESQQAQQTWRYCGGQIKLWREGAGVSRQTLVDEVNYDYEYVKSMENGRRRPTLRLLQAADQLCGVGSVDQEGGRGAMSEPLAWFKSSYSDSQGGECLEVAPCPYTIHIRDSKLGAQGPRFSVSADAWTAFIAHAYGDGA